MSQPWLSIVMPTWNGERFLRAALAGILRQEDDGLEIIAIDDNSTDDTLAILEMSARRLPLTIIRRSHGGNWAANANEGLRSARADHVSLLHQDDFWLPWRLRHLKSMLRLAPDAAMFLHASRFVGEKGETLGTWRCPLPSARFLSPGFLLERLLVQNFIASPAPIFRRDLALAVGGLDPNLWYATDWDLWMKLGACGTTVYSPRPLTAFRVHRLSQTVIRSRRIDNLQEELTTVFERHFARWKAPRPTKHNVREAAGFSRRLNTALFAAFHGQATGWLPLVGRFLSLGPAAWRRFFRDSRVAERLIARMHAGFLRRFASPTHIGDGDTVRPHRCDTAVRLGGPRSARHAYHGAAPPELATSLG